MYLLTEEDHETTGLPASRVFRRSTSGVWTSTWLPEKAMAMAYDQHSDELTVGYSATASDPATLITLDPSLDVIEERELVDVCVITDLEVLGGYQFLGTSVPANGPGTGCNDRVSELQSRTPTGALRDAHPIQVSALALDLQDLPLSLGDEVDLWRVGHPYLGDYQVQYELVP